MTEFINALFYWVFGFIFVVAWLAGIAFAKTWWGMLLCFILPPVGVVNLLRNLLEIQ